MTSIGQERGQTVMNCFNTVLMLRMNEPSMMERAAKRLGMQDMETVSQNQALAVTEWRDGAGMARTQQERWLVMPSEFGSLAACEGFIKLSGNYPAGRVDYTQWIAKQWIGPNYADQFRPKQDTPPRNPKFLLARAYAAGSVDPIAIVSQKLKEEKNAKAAEASAAATSTVASTTTSTAASTVVAKASAAPKAGGTGKARLRLVPAATQTPENSAAPQPSLTPMQADMFEGDLSSRPAAPPISTAQDQVNTHLRDMQQSSDGIEPLPSKDLGDRDFERLDF
jgi:hypothetical protein